MFEVLLMTEPETLRKVPREIEGKMLSWRHWGVIWSLVHWFVGVSSTTLSGFVAANAKTNFLSPNRAMTLAALAGGLAFLITALDAGKKGTQFQSASRHLEAAISLYQADASLEPKFLGQKQAEALEKFLSGTPVKLLAD
jgi:hypothetical protein